MADHAPKDCTDPTRRRLLQAGLGAAALGALPVASLADAQAPSGFDWKRFKGEKIEVLLVKSPRGDLLTKYHKEFEDMSGIEVGSEMIPEQQQRQKAVIEFNSGNPSFDVIGLSYLQEQLACRCSSLHQRQDHGGAGSRLRRLRQGRSVLCG
jgi:multiple sugar transport system substrate-binding protein